MNRGNSVGILMTVILAFALLIPVSGTMAQTPSPSYYLVTFSELPSSGAIAALESTGVEVLDYMNDGVYLVRSTGQIKDNSIIDYYSVDTRPFTAEMKVSKELQEMSGVTDLRVEIHQGAELEPVLEAIVAVGGTVKKVHNNFMTYIQCTVNLSNIVQLSSVPQVRGIYFDAEPQSFMNIITDNVYMGHDTPQAGGYRGGGILAEVQDNGCDLNHPDLDSVMYTDGFVSDGDHGSCTTGIVFGDGSGQILAQGIAYEATGVFSDWQTGRSTSVINLWNGDFNEGFAGTNGVVQSNSWGSGNLDGQYTTYSNENDLAANNYPHVLTLWALGNANDGTGSGLITQDSTAKNVIGVGGIYHKNTANMADDEYQNNGVGNSPSLGPAADGRQKPDLCAPFDQTYTTDSVDGDGENGYATGNYFTSFGGTSGATPITAGSAVLAYDMYQDNFFGNNPTNDLPYSATIKALLIADAAQYPLTSASRNCQGWGVADMENMYDLGETYHQIHEYPQALGSGDFWSEKVYSDGLNPLKITLAWNDPAAPSTTGTARTLRNNLDLKVTSPGGTVYYGNNGLYTSLWSASGTSLNQWSMSASYRDDLNNVENVFVQTPSVGLWTIEVSGRTGDIAIGPQDFSVVASGGMVPVTSEGYVYFDADSYHMEDSVSIELGDRDLNINPSTVQTTMVNVNSMGEPAGENVVLTETGVNTGIFSSTLTVSASDFAGVLKVNSVDTITVTYNDADDGTGSPAVVTDTASIDEYAPPPGSLNVDHYGPSTQTFTQTRYMRGVSLEANVNGMSTYLLGTTQSATGVQSSLTGNRGTVSTGFRAWVRHSGGSETEITGGNAQAIVSRAVNGGGVQSATWSCPFTATSYTDSLVIRIYQSLSSPPTDLKAEFTTEQLGSTNLDANTWTVSYYTTRGASNDYFWWGDSTYDSKIEGLKWTSDSAPTDHNMLNWTRSPDDGIGANDITHYNIYRSDVLSGPWDSGHLLNTVAATGASSYSYTDTLKGLADATIWYYIVRSVDVLANEDTNTNAVPEPGGSVSNSFEIDLVGFTSGDWAFISYPYPMSGSIQTLLDDSVHGDGQTTWDVAKWYDPLDISDPWKTYRFGASTNDLATIDNTMGLWVHLTANGGDQQLTTGQTGDYSSSAIIIPLYAGWNLVSYPSSTNRIASTTLPGQADLCAYYNGGAAYLITDAVPGITVMSEGNAYWVHVTADTTWSVNP